jgi:hypothetical protein
MGKASRAKRKNFFIIVLNKKSIYNIMTFVLKKAPLKKRRFLSG